MVGGTGAKAGVCYVWLAGLTGDEPRVSIITEAPEIGMMNGVDAWDEETALMADGLLGRQHLQAQFAINGLKVHRASGQGHVYYTTTTRSSVYRLPVTPDLNVAGPVETLASDVVPDDIAVAQDGTVYLCTNVMNTVVRIPPGGDGEVVVVAGAAGDFALAGSTACVFGKGETLLYVATAGALIAPLDGKTEPAKIVDVRLV